MSKFGLEPEKREPLNDEPVGIEERLAAFPTSAPRQHIDIAAMDAAAANHGFVSREAPSGFSSGAPIIRRRRIGIAEPTRHLAIRLTEAQYARFVAFADLQEMTYNEALVKLLDEAGH